MTYLRPHSSQTSRRNRRITSFVVGAAVVIAVIQWLSPQFFPSLFSAVISPFWRVEFSVTNDGMKSRDQLLAENASLLRQISDDKMRYASSTLELLEMQNSDLLALVGRASSTPRGLLAAAVLARPTFMPYDELLIDLGSSDDISTTTLVYAPGRVLIGRVTDILGSTAKVMLFSSPKQSLQVEIGAERVRATASGRGGGQYEAEVPHGSGINVGDVVSDINIHDRAFGIVVSIKTDPANPFDQIFFAPPVNIYQLHFVEVETPIITPVTPPKPSNTAPRKTTALKH